MLTSELRSPLGWYLEQAKYTIPDACPLICTSVNRVWSTFSFSTFFPNHGKLLSKTQMCPKLLIYQFARRTVERICICCSRRKSSANPSSRQIQIYSALVLLPIRFVFILCMYFFWCCINICSYVFWYKFYCWQMIWLVVSSTDISPCVCFFVFVCLYLCLFQTDSDLFSRGSQTWDWSSTGGGSSEDSDISSKLSFVFPQTFVAGICLKIACTADHKGLGTTFFLCRC